MTDIPVTEINDRDYGAAPQEWLEETKEFLSELIVPATAVLLACISAFALG